MWFVKKDLKILNWLCMCANAKKVRELKYNYRLITKEIEKIREGTLEGDVADFNAFHKEMDSITKEKNQIHEYMLNLDFDEDISYVSSLSIASFKIYSLVYKDYLYSTDEDKLEILDRLNFLKNALLYFLCDYFTNSEKNKSVVIPAKFDMAGNFKSVDFTCFTDEQALFIQLNLNALIQILHDVDCGIKQDVRDSYTKLDETAIVNKVNNPFDI